MGHSQRQIRCQLQPQLAQALGIAVDEFDFELANRRTAAFGDDKTSIKTKRRSRPVGKRQRMGDAQNVGAEKRL